ncbi:MAG: enoyl-CoA hydratase-related protein [Pseudomonadota bacterium]
MAIDVKVMDETIAVITLARPRERNAIDRETTRKLEEAIRLVEDSPAIRVAIITGEGDVSFCAGADLNAVAAGELDLLFTPDGGFAAFTHADRAKPWIAAVNGFALAGGCEIALSCDIVIAVENAKFGLPEVKRGLIASAGGLYRLPRALPRSLAFEMIATGDPIDAAKAAHYGLVSQVVPADQLMPAAMAMARRICVNSPLAVSKSLQMARLALDLDSSALYTMGNDLQRELQLTEDYREGSRAFLEKRPPAWRGR